MPTAEKVITSLKVSGVVITMDISRPPEIVLTRLICGTGQEQNGASYGKDGNYFLWLPFAVFSLFLACGGIEVSNENDKYQLVKVSRMENLF